MLQLERNNSRRIDSWFIILCANTESLSKPVMSIDFNQTRVRVWALSTKDLTKTSTSAPLLFDTSWAAPAEWLAGSNTLHYVGGTDDAANGVIAVWDKELRIFYGFSTVDGHYLWQTAGEQWQDAYGWGNVEHTCSLLTTNSSQ